ncbi:hypothetical protein HELRODRAFT_162184 [Helobdella robusta]|uniref:J domain-containing protein n=1 Tax=Helobdella robusta TaxID=6412 RepID=T1ESC1_HELRO|nr:hypothetical protein HELRODRAFT_162184 [Helobdella robusta]ESN98733.1 hypothetical protein HELRODRAFT_162184 [Helobdella robusta]
MYLHTMNKIVDFVKRYKVTFVCIPSLVLLHYGWYRLQFNTNFYSRQIRNHYEILGISEDASAKDIKDAFLKLSKQLVSGIEHQKQGSVFVRLAVAFINSYSKYKLKKHFDNVDAKNIKLYEEIVKNAKDRSNISSDVDTFTSRGS